MKQILRKDPIIEAVCEFHFDAPDWDWAVPGMVYGNIKGRFPERAESPHIDFRVDETPEGVLPSAQVKTGRIQFWAENHQQLVQIGPQQLSIHQLRPYSGWPNFKVLVEQVLSDYERAAPFRGIRRIVLRYVNRLPLPMPAHHIEDLIRVLPQIPDSENQIWTSWFQHVEISQPDKKAALIVRSGRLPSQQIQPGDNGDLNEESADSMLLDLMFAHAAPQPIERRNVSTWLETAHDEIETLFFKSLQPDYLKSFGPEETNENT